MKRSDFIRGISLASLGAVLPAGRVNTATEELAARTIGCTLIPSDTGHLHPRDPVANSCSLRQDIRETKTGIQLNLKLKITNENGEPITNAWVKIWHCDKNGVQITDANGAVEFITVFPGWYSKKVTQIHFRVYLSSVLAATSQLTFPEKAKNIIYTTGTLYTSRGGDPRPLATDNAAKSGYSLQMATITPNVITGGYDSALQVTVTGTGTESLGLAQPETGGQFNLEQNYPNPYTNETHIPFSLAHTSDVEMEIYDLSGRKVANVKLDELPAGDHHFPLHPNSLGIAPGTYIYQLVVTNGNGVFRQCKVMTCAK